MKEEVTIRFATIEDLPAIVNIYNQAIRSGKATGDMYEFRIEDRVEWFHKYDNDVYPCYVAVHGNNVVGYCTISPYRPGRKALSTAAEISYYLDYSLHGKGIGTSLLRHVTSDCKRIGKESLLAILLDVNLQSIGILEKFGFTKWGHFPDVARLKSNVCGHLIYGLNIKNSDDIEG